MTPIIEVKGLSKKYRMGESQPYLTLRDSLVNFVKNPFKKIKKDLNKDEFWALKDINFTVEPGEVVGIIGRNGAGKSTLLKILSRITPPTTGEITLRGRVGSLLEVGTGFQQELTGRENIYLNGAILGMSQVEIRRKFDEIIAFAEVEKFIDTPVKHYSSGMYVRLAFAVAAHLEPEILLVDEVLSVGDVSFQKKCLGKMEDIGQAGRTILFVSHDLEAIRRICTKAILLEKGQITFSGDIDKTIQLYLESVRSKTTSNLAKTSRRGNGKAKFTKLFLTDLSDKKIITPIEGEPFKINLELTVREVIKPNIISITFVDQSGQDLLTTFMHDNLTMTKLKPGKYHFSIICNPNPFIQGFVNLRLACLGDNFLEYDHVHEAYVFEVKQAEETSSHGLIKRPGVFNVPFTWESYVS